MVGTKQRYATGPSMAPWIVAGVVLVVAVAVIAWMLGRDSSSAEPAPVETSSEATPSAAPQAADGCLGGTDPTTAILAAQEEAPLTAEGAAAFAATYTRWRFQAPRAVDDLETVGPQIWTDDVPLEERVEAPVTPGSTLRASLEGQRYQARMVTEGEALVALTLLGYDTQGVYATVQSVSFVSVQVVDGVWRIGPQTDAPSEEFGTTDEAADLRAFKADLLRTGTEFVGGC